MNNNECFFCKEPATIKENETIANFYSVDCSVCRLFFISQAVVTKIQNKELDHELLNCISENIKHNSSTAPITTAWFSKHCAMPSLASDIAIKRYEYVASLPIHHSEKPGNLLQLISELLDASMPFNDVTFSNQGMLKLKIRDPDELVVWLDSLKSSGFIRFSSYVGMSLKDIWCSLTPYGWQTIYNSKKSIHSKKVFIAMQFNWGDDLLETKTAFLDAVKEGCRDCGFEADIVTEHHTEPIMDKIIASIKSSRFVVADFTFNNRGAYFEAGYARALNIPVIHTVKDDHIGDKEDPNKHLHFDIQQINYIKWSDPKELRERIRDRIKSMLE